MAQRVFFQTGILRTEIIRILAHRLIHVPQPVHGGVPPLVHRAIHVLSVCGSNEHIHHTHTHTNSHTQSLSLTWSEKTHSICSGQGMCLTLSVNVKIILMMICGKVMFIGLLYLMLNIRSIYVQQ